MRTNIMNISRTLDMTWRSWIFISWPRNAMLFLITTYTQRHSLLLQTRLCSSVCTSYQPPNLTKFDERPRFSDSSHTCMTMVWFARDFSEIRWRRNSNWEIGAPSGDMFSLASVIFECRTHCCRASSVWCCVSCGALLHVIVLGWEFVFTHHYRVNRSESFLRTLSFPSLPRYTHYCT